MCLLIVVFFSPSPICRLSQAFSTSGVIASQRIGPSVSRRCFS
jgi:hypothetical protein